MNPVCKHGPQTQVRLGQVVHLLPFHYWFTVILLLVYPYLTIGLFLSYYRSHSIAKWALQAKCTVTTNQSVWYYKSKCVGITNRMYDHYKLKCTGITNEMYGHHKSKCMVITSQMYSYYKSSYIQFLTLSRSHDHLYKSSKFLFLASHMTCLYKLSKFPFLVGYMTCLNKHLISPAIFTFWQVT